MGRILPDGADEYCLLNWHEAEPGFIPVEFHSDFGCRQFIRRFLSEDLSMTAIRDMLGADGCVVDLSHLDDHRALEQLAARLLDGRFKLGICTLRRFRSSVLVARGTGSATVGADDAQAQDVTPPPPIAPAAPQTTQWIRFQVVDDATDEPIPGITLKVKLPTGQVQDLTTDADGMIEIKPVPAGTCDIEKMIDDAALEVVAVV